MKLVIKKLFGKYDYDLEFDNKLNILIGENGCGKSTILKIISYLANKDMCSLSKINFESISLSNAIDSATIYRDTIVQQNAVNQYDFRRRLFDFITQYDLSEENVKDIDFETVYADLLMKLNSDMVYQKCEDFDNFEEFLEKDFQMFGFKYDKRNFDSYNYREEFNCPYGSKMYFFYIFLLAINYTKGEKYVRHYSIPDEYKQFNIFERIINSEERYFSSKIKVYDFTYFLDKNQKKLFNTFNQNKIILKFLKENPQDVENTYDYIQNYYNNDEIIKIHNIIDIIIKNMKRYSILEKPIFMNYNEEFEFLNDFYDSLNNYFNANDSSVGFFECKNYNVQPMCNYIVDNYDSIRKEFYNDNQIQKFIELTKKYITTKTISFDDNMNYNIIDNFTGKSIAFESLSSGERKIIYLLEIICFSKNDSKSNILLLDEPELSLSIFWQEMILDDLLESEYNKIILCTQSPNLLSEDTIKYIIEVKK